MRLWRLMSHHQKPHEAAELYRRNRFLAIGWGLVGDLKHIGAGDSSDVSAALHRVPEYRSLQNLGAGGRCLWAFCSEMAIGDLVIVADTEQRRYVMEVTSDYFWDSVPDPVIGDFQHQRKAMLTGHDPDALWAMVHNELPEGWSPRWPLLLCAERFQGI